MKIEKINDNQIRCTLNQQDLQSREIKISELAYGTQKAKDLFHDMIEQADHEFGFHTDDMPLMIEAIPISVDCIVLVITKVEDPEELDTRFSRFAPSDEDGNSTSEDSSGSNDFFDEKEELEGLDGELSEPEAEKAEETTSETDSFIPFSEMLRDATARIAPEIKNFIDTICSGAQVNISATVNGESAVESDEPNSDSEEPAFASEEPFSNEAFSEASDKAIASEGNTAAVLQPEEPTTSEAPAEKAPAEVLTRLFSFENWNEASYAAAHINADYDGDSIFYKDESQGCYFLLLTGSSDDKIRFFAVSNELTEYAHKLKPAYYTEAYLEEHCKLIIRTDALRILKEY